MDLFIIINQNINDLLEQYLSAVYTNPADGDFEISVVNSAFADASASMIASQFSQACLVENTSNVGFAAAAKRLILVPFAALFHPTYHQEYAVLARHYGRLIRSLPEL